MRSPSLFAPPLRAALLWLGLAALSAGPADAQTATPGGFNLGLGAGASPILAPTSPPPGQGYQPPKVIKRGDVAYPILANLNRIEGVVGVRFAVDENGKVTGATVYKTSRSLTLDAVVKSRGIMDWTFQPATLNGKPVPSTYDQEIEFHLDPNEQRDFALKRLAAPVGIPDPPYPAEALNLHPHPRGDVTIGVFWTPAGRVDLINLIKSSGSATLDHAALRFAYLNWRIDPKEITDPKVQYTKVLSFTPPDDGTGTPAPLDSATPTPAPTATPKSRRAH